jgi:hypothetical protein
VSYPLESVLYQWEEGHRRLRELSADPRSAAQAHRAVEAIRDELRRRIGPTFSARQLADLYGAGTDRCLEAARWTIKLNGQLDPAGCRTPA